MTATITRALILVAAALVGPAAAAPLTWHPPAGFDPHRPGLGLPQLPGVRHEILYAPFPSHASVEAGGGGRYESPHHGTYNHHTLAVALGDHVVVYWTNHSDDENGPGQRILARWGYVRDGGRRIDWGDPEDRLVELVPPPVPVRRRLPLEAEIDRRFVRGNLEPAGDQLISRGTVALYHGWTDDLAYRFPGHDPVPDERFSATAEIQGRFRYDMRWDLGPRYVQAWGFRGGGLIPLTSLLVDAHSPPKLALTPTLDLTLPPLQPAFTDVKPVAEWPVKVDRAHRADELGRPHYSPGTSHLASNGIHALAHRAEFHRPDGTWVILRDNLADPGSYYAAEAPAGESYPPAVPTGLYGHAMPAAGELDDGRVWIIGNSEGRRDFFLTLSRDGIHFDQTWLLLHVDKAWRNGFAKPRRGGPQYPFALRLGETLWVFYSIGKEQIGATSIPIEALLSPR